jgi:hypothetical protein
MYCIYKNPVGLVYFKSIEWLNFLLLKYIEEKKKKFKGM